MTKVKNVSEFKTVAARSRAIGQLRKKGFNYFVCYTSEKNKAAIQYSKSTSKWFRKYAKRGLLITGA